MIYWSLVYHPCHFYASVHGYNALPRAVVLILLFDIVVMHLLNRFILSIATLNARNNYSGVSRIYALITEIDGGCSLYVVHDHRLGSSNDHISYGGFHCNCGVL